MGLAHSRTSRLSLTQLYLHIKQVNLQAIPTSQHSYTTLDSRREVAVQSPLFTASTGHLAILKTSVSVVFQLSSIALVLCQDISAEYG